MLSQWHIMPSVCSHLLNLLLSCVKLTWSDVTDRGSYVSRHSFLCSLHFPLAVTPSGRHVVIPGGGLVARQQRQHHGDVQLCARPLPGCGQELPAAGAAGVPLHADALHHAAPQGLGGHLQGAHNHTQIDKLVAPTHFTGSSLCSNSAVSLISQTRTLLVVALLKPTAS